MKFLIISLSLFTLLALPSTPVLAVTHPSVHVHTTLNFEPKTAEPKPKWVKILEWAIPIFLLLAIILFATSLVRSSSAFSILGGSSYIGKSDNFLLGLIAFGVAVASAMTLVVYRIIKVFKKRT
jgi:hypothetical protein